MILIFNSGLYVQPRHCHRRPPPQSTMCVPASERTTLIPTQALCLTAYPPQLFLPHHLAHLQQHCTPELWRTRSTRRCHTGLGRPVLPSVHLTRFMFFMNNFYYYLRRRHHPHRHLSAGAMPVQTKNSPMRTLPLCFSFACCYFKTRVLHAG